MKLPQNQQNQHWLVVWNMTFMTFMTFHILGMSSQLTLTPSFFGVAKNHQPECIHGTAWRDHDGSDWVMSTTPVR